MDENHHFLFYRDMAKAAMEIDPNQAVEAMERQIIGFAMPGEGIPDFAEPTPRPSPRPASTTWPPTTSRSSSRSCSATGTSPAIEALSGRGGCSRGSGTIAYIEKSKRVADRIAARRKAKEAEGSAVPIG